jgi:predicted outer membrane repeat protein
MSICFLAGSLSAQTMINGGNVSGTWTVDNSPYLIYDEITIPNDSTLTIEPGVSVEFQGHYALQVQGRLLALGSENDTILFTINDSTGFSDPDTTLGGWNGIRFIDTPQSNDSSRIIFCKLEYGKAVADVWHLNAGGALCVINFDKVLVSNSLINHNIAGGLLTESPSGGAVHLAWSDIRFVETTFSYNSAHNGGAIQCHESSPTFIDCKFAYNIATESGGIAVDGECYVTLSDCQLLSNHSQNLGGGILFSSNSRSRLDNVTLAGNTANWGAGIGAFSCELELENCTLTGNVSSGLGGGIAIDNSQLNINNCTFMQNSAGTGGGIHSDKCDLQIENSMFEQNMTSSGDAGALNYLADTLIFDRPYQVNIINNRFIKNEAMGICGGIKLDQVNSDTSLIDIKIDQCEFDQNHANRVSPLRISGFISNFTLTNSLFRGNTSTQWTAGPGFVADCSGQVLNCVFSSNYAYKTDSSATLNGSSVGARAHVDYINCTITDTSNNGGVGLSFRGGATGTILNSIIWGCGDNPIHLRTTQEMGAAVYVNYCNLENGLDSVYISDSLSTLHWGIGNISEDPQFNDIQSGDLHLRDTSPGIGSGIDCFILDDVTYCAPETDIAGNPRPAPQGSNPDLGAFENNLAAPTFIDGTISDLPLHFGLDQNFPNPFNPTTKINYELPIANYVNLSVYNLLGQKMVTLVDEKQIAGQHQVIWNASEFASGVYLYRLKTESGYIETKKMILLR